MNRFLTLALTMLFFAGTNKLNAQGKLTIDKVYSVYLQSSGPILANDEIKGYYFFYQSDKIDRSTNEYTLQIVDENLNKLKDIKFTDSKKINLLESSFNGNAMVFMFFDEEQEMLDYRVYGTDGKKISNYSKSLDKRSLAYFKQATAQSTKEEGENKNVYDIEGKGFIAYTPMRENKKYTYDISFYASEKKKSWSYAPDEEGKYTTAQYLGANDSIALFEVISKEKLTARSIETTLLGLNLANGKKRFEVRTVDASHQLFPMNMVTREDGTSMLIGPYYNGDERVLQDQSDGLGLWIINNDGKVVNSKYNSWTKDISKFLKIDQKGRVADIGDIYFHNLLQTDDGKIFAIGEGYKKTANAAGIAMSALSGSYNSNTTKLVITDMVMLQLSDKFELQDAKIYEKNRNSFALPGSDFASSHTLAVIAKMYGAFDYTYSQMGKNKASFVSSYTDYEKSKDYKGLVFHSISYYDGKLTNDQINLKTSASKLRVLPAKAGSVLLLEYYKKDKKLELRMEKIN